ncbi:hypothetical protein MRX96_056803 [Rhipicephalus microplus]
MVIGLNANPFLDPERWLKIADRLSKKKKLKSSGTEEEQSELEDLLQQATDIADECGYMPQPSTIRQLAERDGIKRATGNSVARPPAKRRVNNREEDALAAYAEFTVGGRC